MLGLLAMLASVERPIVDAGARYATHRGSSGTHASESRPWMSGADSPDQPDEDRERAAPASPIDGRSRSFGDVQDEGTWS
jgi:hypothetical protein